MTDFQKKTCGVFIFLIVLFQTASLHAQDPQKAKKTSSGMGYLEYLPADYASTTKTYPVIIFLHGAGERGTGSPADLEKLKVHGPPMHISKRGHNMCFTVNGKQECFIVLSPQIDAWSFRGLITPFVQWALQNYRIDPNRVCLTGLSMGGEGTWYTAAETLNSPNYFAAISPMSGKASVADGVSVANKRIPVWAFHGDADKANSLASATLPITGMLLGLANPPPIMTIIPGGDHGAGWERGYRTDHSFANPNVYEWFLQQRKIPVNGVAPVVNAGGDKTITLPVSTAAIKATATDADGEVSSYAWTKISGPAATLTATNTATLNVSNASEGTYSFRILVTDNHGLKAEDEINLNVKPGNGNTPPTVSAGTDQTITLPTSTAKFTAAASDPGGSVASYAWTKTSGPAATLSNTNTSALTVSNAVEGTYVFRATVTDNGGLNAYDEATLIVKRGITNTPPTVNGGADKTITLPVSTTSFTATASDPGGSIATYTWSQVSGPSPAALSNNTTSTVTISNAAAGQYVFRISVKDDGGLTASDDVILNVLQPTNTPPVVNAGADKVIILPSSSTSFSATASDPGGSISTYTWSKLSGPAATLSNANTATLGVSGATTAGVYVFRLTVKDNGGLTAYDDVALTVAANAAPTVSAGMDKTVKLPLNTATFTATGAAPNGQIKTYSWTKISGPSATLTATNTETLSVSNVVEGTYYFLITITDNLGLSASDEVKLMVTPNTAPTVNAGNDMNVALPLPSVLIKASAVDSGGQIALYSWTKLSGPGVTLNRANTVTLSLTDLVAGTYTFRITVTDNGGLTAYDDIKLTVTGGTDKVTVNQPPVVNAGTDQIITLPASSTTFNAVASDPEGAVVSYAWKQIGGCTITLGSTTSARLTLSNAIQCTYVFRVEVTDDKGLKAADTIRLRVNPAGKALMAATESMEEETPTALGQNYPNPFVNSTIIPFTLDKAQHVEIKIFDGTGAELGTLINADLDAGPHEAELQSEALGNNNVKSGMYYYKLITREKVITKRLVKKD